MREFVDTASNRVVFGDILDLLLHSMDVLSNHLTHSYVKTNLKVHVQNLMHVDPLPHAHTLT